MKRIRFHICLVHIYMGQKDQDGNFAEQCHFFSTLELKYTNFKTGPNKSRNMQNTILSIRVIIWFFLNSAVYTSGAPRGPGAEGPNRQGQAQTTDLDPWPSAPMEFIPAYLKKAGMNSVARPPLVYPALFCYQIRTLIDKIVHYIFFYF